MRLDSAGKIKWATWYYDSTKGVLGSLLFGKGIINCVKETSRGTIICAAGDEYPNNNGLALNNYAAFLEFSAIGKKLYAGESYNSTDPAWHSPLSYSSGTITRWDTAGVQGGSDEILDFTQLKNGNLLLVGRKGYTGIKSGLWAFVKDSMGRKLLWEAQFQIPFRTDNGAGLFPLSVCATSDGGFTVVGRDLCNDANGANNAFAAHFKPAAPVGVVRKTSPAKILAGLSARIIGQKLVVSGTGTASLYDITGRKIAERSGNKEIEFDISGMSRGMYIVKVKSNAGLVVY
jgi:hypothetical protein